MKAQGKKVAVLVEQMYQELEVWYPYYRLKEAGFAPLLVGSGTAKVYPSKVGYPAEVETDVTKIKPADFAAVVVPGGFAPDFMRRVPAVAAFIRQAYDSGAIIAAICHGGWMLCSADLIRGVKVTSFIAIKDDMVNAGGLWSDQEVVVDRRIITSRKPDDLPAFCRELLRALAG